MLFSQKKTVAAAAFAVFSFLNVEKEIAQTVQNQRVTLDSVLLSPIIVEAQRVGEGSAIPHTNFSKTAILEQNQGLDAPYLLQSVPSLVVSSDAGAGVGYTAMRLRGSDQTHLNVTINGVPLNDAESQQVFWVDLPDFGSSAESIQVQRGVGSSSNGAGSFGGTVNLTTDQVKSEPFSAISASVGSFGTLRGTIQFGTGLLEKGWAAEGRFSKIASDGFIDRAASDLDSRAFSLSKTWATGAVKALHFGGKERTYQAWYGVPAQFIDDIKLRTFNPAGTERADAPHPDQVDDYSQNHFQLIFNQKIYSKIIANLTAHYTRGKGFYEEYKSAQNWLNYGGDTSLESSLIRRRFLDNHFFGLISAVNYENTEKRQKTTLGGGWHRYLGNHFGEVIWAEKSVRESDAQYYQNNGNKNDFNIFLKTEKTWSKLTAAIDLQFRQVNYVFDGKNNDGTEIRQSERLPFFNPKVSATYSNSIKNQFYAFIGATHREPNRDDYVESTENSRPRPERLIDYEMGWRFRPSKKAAATVNVFFMDYFDQLVLTGRLNDVGAATRVNVPRSHRAGLEIDGFFTFLERGKLAGNVAASQNRIRKFTEFVDVWDDGSQAVFEQKNTDLSYSPSFTSSVDLSWGFSQKPDNQRVTSVLTARRVGKQYLDNTSSELRKLDAWTVFDFKIIAAKPHFLGRETQLIFSVLNLLNQKYESNGWTYRFRSDGYDPVPDDPTARSEGNGFYNLSGFFPQAGRHFLATLNVLF